MPVDNKEQKKRRELSNLVDAEIRVRAKASGWKTAKGWLFREHKGWLIDARPAFWVTERKSTLQLRCKPLNIDPLLWEIVETQENNFQPLSFRLFGAWTVSTPPLCDVEVEEGTLDAAGLASAMLQAAQCEFDRARANLNLEAFHSSLTASHARSPTQAYLAAAVCALVLLDRRDEARGMCISAKERGDAGGFQVGARTFPDLALEWISKSDSTRH